MNFPFWSLTVLDLQQNRNFIHVRLWMKFKQQVKRRCAGIIHHKWFDYMDLEEIIFDLVAPKISNLPHYSFSAWDFLWQSQGAWFRDLCFHPAIRKPGRQNVDVGTGFSVLLHLLIIVRSYPLLTRLLPSKWLQFYMFYSPQCSLHQAERSPLKQHGLTTAKPKLLLDALLALLLLRLLRRIFQCLFSHGLLETSRDKSSASKHQQLQLGSRKISYLQWIKKRQLPTILRVELSSTAPCYPLCQYLSEGLRIWRRNWYMALTVEICFRYDMAKEEPVCNIISCKSNTSATGQAATLRLNFGLRRSSENVLSSNR